MKEWDEKTTIGDKYHPAMKITDQAEADAWFERLVKHNMDNTTHDRARAEGIERSNLGYFAGYYDHETRLRVERLFRCTHPIFGPASAGPVSPETAFAAGKALGEKARAS